MYNLQERVKDWYSRTINQADIDSKTQATLDYIKRFKEPEEGIWEVWAYEVVSGAHGSLTVRIFLDEVLGEHDHYTQEEDRSVIMGLFDTTSSLLASCFNQHTSLPGSFVVGHHEADWSLGVYYTVKA